MGLELRRLLPDLAAACFQGRVPGTWWAFAFLPFPPRSLADLEQIFWQSINLFNSPSGIVTPLGVLPSAFIGFGLFLLGAWSLGRRWKGGLFLLVSPIRLGTRGFDAASIPVPRPALTLLGSIGSFTRRRGRGGARAARRSRS